MKIFEKVIYGFYILSIIFTFCIIIFEHNGNYISNLMWIFNSFLLFVLYEHTDKQLSNQRKMNIELIETLLKQKEPEITNILETKKEDE